ncbi:MAG: FAD-binding protein [Acidimicrobiia bacterium]
MTTTEATDPGAPHTRAPQPAPPAGRVVRDLALLAFAEEIGGPAAGPVAVEGGRTQWAVGAIDPAMPDDPAVRLVRAPTGVVAFEPAEMTVLVRAGTTLAELDAALAPSGQQVALEGLAPEATVGGVLSVGRSGITRLGHGPVRDTLLQARYVSADGLLVTAGGPTVKNVTGFDLCRLLVGSLGTIGLLGDVLLRTRPRPQASGWWHGETDPFALFDALYRPTALLWDGTAVWLRLDGYRDDVADQAALAERAGLRATDGPPSLPTGRTSVDPGALRGLDEATRTAGGFVAEIGVGVVHGTWPGPRPAGPDRHAVALNRRVRRSFDPTGRLNPGRDPLAAGQPPTS